MLELAAATGRSLLEEQLAQVALAAEGGLEVVAEWDGQLRGHLVVSGRNGRGGGGEVALFVAGDWRGVGVGQLLLAVAEAWAREAGIGSLWLEVERGNEAAIALYERVGFEDDRPAGQSQLRRLRMPL